MDQEKKNENSYRNILKGTSLFGGVQVFQILVNLIRGKFVAMFLGPEGMGMSSLFASSANTISQMSSLGLQMAFTKEVAENRSNPDRIRTVISVALATLQLTGIVGAFATVLLAPWLSRISFGNEQYSWQFMGLAIAVYFMVTGGGKVAILQGLHSLKIISASMLSGAVIGLVAGVPLYYLFGTRGIVPAMILVTMTQYICFTIGLRRAAGETPKGFSWKSHKGIIRRFISLGMVLMASSLVNTGCIYALNIFIRGFGQLADVGLYNAVNSLTNQYSGIVFTAMSMDFLPRLAAIAKDNVRMREVVNRQLEIVSLIIAPAVVVLIALSPVVIRVLLTSEFLSVTPLMRWMGLGVLLKAIAYPMGYIAFAKDNKRLFFWMEAIAENMIFLLLSVSLYSSFGLPGLGYAPVADSAISIALYYTVNRRVYGYSFNIRAIREIAMAMIMGVAAFLGANIADTSLSYYVMAAIFIISAAWSVWRLRALLRK